MIGVELQGVDFIRNKIKRRAKRLAYTNALAMTRTGQKAKEIAKQQITKKFSNPVGRTKNAVYLQRATVGRQFALVGIVDRVSKGNAPADYLGPSITGRSRGHTRFEGALRAAGILGPNEYAMPSRYAKKNRYGNITAGVYTRVLSQLRATRGDYSQHRTGSARSKRSRRASAYFYVRDGKARGIWDRRARSVKPLFIFTSSRPDYKKVFPFSKIVLNIFQRQYAAEFAKAMEQERATRIPRG